MNGSRHKLAKAQEMEIKRIYVPALTVRLPACSKPLASQSGTRVDLAPSS